MDANPTNENDQTYFPEAAEEGGIAAVENILLDPDGGPKDVEYASIDFSLLKRKSPREAGKLDESTETEYAEIKKKVKEKREENGSVEGEISKGKEKALTMGKEEETNVPEEENGKDAEVYSNLKNILSEV